MKRNAQYIFAFSFSCSDAFVDITTAVQCYVKFNFDINYNKPSSQHNKNSHTFLYPPMTNIYLYIKLYPPNLIYN